MGADTHAAAGFHGSFRVVHRKGRKSVAATALELYAARRARGIPLCADILPEAEAIQNVWPDDGPPRPKKADTIRRRISARWHADWQRIISE
jgi:hypothetical protein